MQKEDHLVVDKGVKPLKGKKRKKPELVVASEVKAQQSKRHRGSMEPCSTRRSMRHSSRIKPAGEKDEEEVVEIVDLDMEQEDGARPQATSDDTSTKSQKEHTGSHVTSGFLAMLASQVPWGALVGWWMEGSDVHNSYN